MAQTQTRMARQRAVILEELRKLKSHPTADELYSIVRERLPRISLGTVYRNLDFLADSGEIRRLEAAGSTKRFDGDISNHQHEHACFVASGYQGFEHAGRVNAKIVRHCYG